jgi:ribosome-associated translation inhibitor RaiA
MKILVNTDSSVEVNEKLFNYITNEINSSLHRVSDRISRIEVHLSDEDGGKNSMRNNRCLIEARFKGRQPISVTNQDTTLDNALKGAIDKLLNLIDNTLGRLQDKRRKDTDPELN